MHSTQRPSQVRNRVWLGISLCLIWLVHWSSLVQGQGVLVNIDGDHPIRLPRPIIIVPPWPQPQPPVEPSPVTRTYRVKSVRADVRWSEGVARVQLAQTFVNTGSSTLEAAFVFPIPADGVVDGLTLLVDGKEFTGKMLKADEAKRIYQSYVQRNRDPALLEWIGHGMFQTNVFPIPAGAERTVTINYTQVTRSVFGMVEWLLPLQGAKYTGEPVETVEVNVHISTPETLKNIYSPTHAISIDRPSDKTAVVKYRAEKTVPSQDFRLFFDHQAEPMSARALSYWPEGESEGYFMLLTTPPASDPAQTTTLAKSVIIVLDTSGSMSGKKMEQAQQACRFILDNLKTGDLFNIVAYSDRVETFQPELQKLSDDTRKAAHGYVAGLYAGGSTNISDGLAAALNMLQDAERPNYVVFLTDGLPTAGITEPAKIVAATKEQNKVRARMFCFGVGYDVNSRLLDTLGRVHSGLIEYVRPDEDIERYVSNLYRGIASPVLSHLELTIDPVSGSTVSGPVTARRYPETLPDLFAEQQFMLVGKYRQAGEMKVRFKGQQGSAPREYVMSTKFADKSSSSQYAFVARLWATRRIGEIIDQLDLEGQNQELVDELVELAKKHGIMTPYTSFLAEEPNVLATRGRLGRVAEEAFHDHFDAESGAIAFEARAFKQQLKLSTAVADNSQPLSAPSPVAAVGGYGGRAAAGGSVAFAPAGPAQPGIASTPAGSPPTEPAASAPRVLTVGAKTFYRLENQWVEAGLTEDEVRQARSVERFSDDYFGLLNQHGDEIGQYLSIDDTVVIKLGTEIVRF